MASVLEHFGNLPWPLAVIGLLLFSTFNQLQFIVFAPIYHKVASRFSGTWGFVALAMIYTAVDAICPKLFRDTLGHATYELDWLRQVADLSGIQLLTFLAALHNFALKSLWDRRQDLKSARLPYATILGLFVLALGYGAWRSHHVQTIQNTAPKNLRLGLIQPGIGDIDKLAAKTGNHFSAAKRIMQNLEQLSLQASFDSHTLGQTPQAIIWPETSYPNLFRKPRGAFDVPAR